MEEKGIGRPSTYATIMAKLTDKKREYVKREKKFLVPNPVSYDLVDFLVKYFGNIMDISFTARMETALDDIGAGGKDWHKLIADFYAPFERQLDRSRITEKLCDKCGAPMLIKSGKYGPYYACSNHPNCQNIKAVNEKVAIPTKDLREGPHVLTAEMNIAEEGCELARAFVSVKFNVVNAEADIPGSQSDWHSTLPVEVTMK
jgi:DNA topoisomerase-1